MPHMMSLLVEMRHIVVHTVRETPRPGPWGIVRFCWSARGVLRALLAVSAPAS
jgi:hypothetical protein